MYYGRRLRRTEALRTFVEDIHLHKTTFIMPYFLLEGRDDVYKRAIPSMPNQYQMTIPAMLEDLAELVALGLQAVILFGIPQEKDMFATRAYANDGVIPLAISAIKQKFPHIVVISDVCLCAYTSHGHCGILRGDTIDNEASVDTIAQVAFAHAKAGADIVAPSDMMDGRVAIIRNTLNSHSLSTTAIASYAVKYSSFLYSPFRDAADSAPQFGDRKTYQMSPARRYECITEVESDIKEGADMLIIKPAGLALDVLARVQAVTTVPCIAYQVSGEYVMLANAITQGLFPAKEAILESLIAIKRAGANSIISYWTKEILQQQYLG